VHCPICTQPLEGGELVMVCSECHKGLGAPGAMSLGTTGEFKVPSEADVLAAASMPNHGERPTATNTCSWCGKLEPQVKKLLGRGGVALCNECISLACDILDAEVGNWR
jgi:hypothetical protein